MTTMQVYWVRASDHIERARPGQFVHMSDHDDRVCGFIGAVDLDQGRVQIYLFDPVPVQPFAEVVHETLDNTTWLARLTEILNADPKLKRWQLVLQNGAARN